MIKSIAFAAAIAAVAGGCMFRDVKEQQARMAAYCPIEGEVAAERRSQAPLVVLLLRQEGGEAARRESWALSDHFVLEGAGRWQFRASAGNYRLAAFQDLNGDLKYQPGEPFLRADPGPLLDCRTGEPHRGIALRIPAAGTPSVVETMDVARLQARGVEEQLQRSLGELTAVGELAALSDARFAESVAEDGLWRPFDFLIKAGAGVYFLEPYDPAKLPVLFVHGINGTPANFRTLIARLDREHFQPWVYYYPSGAALDAVADHLTQTMRKLQVAHGFTRFAVVAHSMGGLVTRGFLLRYAESGGRAAVPLYVTISTPWGGHKAAELGVKTAPAVVRVWVDMAPGSEYQRSLFYKDPGTQRTPRTLPRSIPHHLLFTYNQGSVSLGEANDGTVTVASQLRREAQRDATRLYGFNETHMGVLESEEVSGLLNDLLRGARATQAAR
jgi:pimeloyl-ACP methyl ester carboxylesterase